MRRTLGALALACVLSLLTGRAEAQFSLGGLFGWGLDFKNDNLNRFGFDLGARAGYTLSSGMYLGGVSVFHFGNHRTIAGVDTTWRMLQLGGEVGYDLGIGPVIVRPYGGIGVMVEFVNVGPGNDNATDLYLNYGATVLYPIRRFFVGGDAHFATVFADNTFSGFIMQLTGGYAWGAKQTGVKVRVQKTDTGKAVEFSPGGNQDEESNEEPAPREPAPQ